MTGLELTGVTSSNLTSTANWKFQSGSPSGDSNTTVVLPAGTTNYSLLVVDSDITAEGTITITSATSTALTSSAPTGLSTLTGLYITNGNEYKANGVTNIALTASGSLGLTALDLSDGGTYTGEGADVFTANTQGGIATALKIGSGEQGIGTSVAATATAKAATTATKGLTATAGLISQGGSLADIKGTTTTNLTGTVDFSDLNQALKGVTSTATGLEMTGGAVSLINAETTGNAVTLNGEVKSVANYTGTANAYGLNITGGEFNITAANTAGKATIGGLVSQGTGEFGGTGNAYGISAVDSTVKIDLTGSQQDSTISGNVGNTNGATGAANAYGIFASGADAVITINNATSSGSATISAQVGNADGTAITNVAQQAAAIWAENGATVNLNSTGQTLTITATNNNTLDPAEGNKASVAAYGIYADSSDVNMAGTISITATAKDMTNEKASLPAYGIYATDSTVAITGGKATATLVTVVKGDVSVSGEGALNITGTNATETGQGYSATLTLSAQDLNVDGAALTLQAGSSNKTNKGGDALISLTASGGNDITISGSEVLLQGGAAGSGADGGNAGISLTQKGNVTISGSQNFQLIGGNANGGQSGGAATISLNEGNLTITDSQISLVAGTDDDTTQAGQGGAASITVTNGNFVLGDGTDSSSIDIGSGATLTLGNTASNTSIVNTGSTIEVQNKGKLAAGQKLTINDGAQLILNKGAIVSGTSTIEGTLAINGTSAPDADGVGPYTTGLGSMTINGEVTSDSDLYLNLINNDKVAFGEGSSMTAQQVVVGADAASSAATNSTLTIDGGTININTLTVGDETTTGKGKVELTGGILTLGDPTAPEAEGQTYPDSSLTINADSVFNLSDDGVLVTDSQNLWQQKANTDPGEDPLTNNIGNGGTINATGGYIELTDKTVDVSWLAAAQKTDLVGAGHASLIIDGQLQQNSKAVASILPMTPQGATKSLVYNTGDIAGVTMLLGTSLNAQPDSFTNADTKKTTSYANLVIGATTQNIWTQPTPQTQLWSIDGVDEVGFSTINIGDYGNILVTEDTTLVLAGDGTNAVIGNSVNVYVGTQNKGGAGGQFAELILGATPNASKGGAINGNVTAYKGFVAVEYAAYSITGTLTLGQAQVTGSGTGTINATGGSLGVFDGGSLTVGSINGAYVADSSADGGPDAGITIDNGSLNVLGDMTVGLVDGAAEPEFIITDNGSLVVGNNLTITSANPVKNPVAVDMQVVDGDIQVAADFSAKDVNISLTGSSLTVGGTFNHSATATTTANGLALAFASKGEVATTVKVTGDLNTVANTITVEGSSLEIGGDFNVNGQLINKVAQTNLTLDDAQITAANINLTNVNSNDGTALYQSADITTGTMSLANSRIEVDDGKLAVGVLNVNPTSTLTLGMSQGDFDALGDDQPDGLVVEASIDQVKDLAGQLKVQGVAPAAGGQTEVAIGQFTFDTAAETAANVVLQGDAALILGSNNVEDFTPSALVDPITKAAPEITTYLVAGQTVQLGLNNGIATGTEVTQPQNSGVSIGAGTGVIINPKLLAKNGAVYGEVGNRQADLFVFDTTQLEEGQTAPGITVDPTAKIGVSNPLGNLRVNLYQGLDAEGLTLSEQQLVQPDNPLYHATWQGTLVEGSEPAEYENPYYVVAIDPTQVSGQPDSVNSLGTNTILNAADIGYGFNEGANKILDLLSIATYANKETAYAQIRNQINQWALQGAAAHAHEIGISAASMVVDSVWDHSSKLAAAPHEEAKGDVWITLDWNHSRANDYKAGGLDNGYKLDLYGATFGADYDFANGLAAGLAVSVGGGEAKSKGINAGQKTDVTYWGINLYGTYASPIVNVIGNVGYIGIKNKTKVGGDKGRPDANIWTIGVKAEKDFAINEQFTVTPHVGVRYLSVDVDDFNLGGFHYGTDKANLVQFPIGVAFAANLKTANGASVKPFLDLSFVPTAGDKKVDNTFGITGGNASDVIDTTIASTSMFQGKIGVNASYGAHNFGLNFAIGGGNKGRLDTGLQAKYRFVF